MRNPVFGVSDQVDTNWAVQPLKMDRGLKFFIWKVEGLYYLRAKTMALVTTQLMCTFVFTYVNSRFFHDAAHVILGNRNSVLCEPPLK